MMNKKNIITLNTFLLIVGLLSTNLVAQKVYVEVSGQYGAPILGDLQVQETNIYYHRNEPIEEIIEERRFSIGQGIQANVALGVTLTDYMSVKLKASYFRGRSIEDFHHNTHRIDINTNRFSATRVTLSGKGSYMGLSPMLMIHSPSAADIGSVRLSMGMGITFALPSFHQSDSIVFHDGQFQYWERDYASHLVIGAVGEVGLLYKYSERISVKAALQATILNFTPRSSKVTVLELNGESSIRLLNTRYRETEYGDHTKTYYIGSDNELIEIINEDEPKKSASFIVPLSNLAFEIGAIYSF